MLKKPKEAKDMAESSNKLVVLLLIVVVILAVGVTWKISSDAGYSGSNDNSASVSVGEIKTQGYVGIKIEPKQAGEAV